MKLITTKEEFENLKSKDSVICECLLCKSEFEAQKKYVVREIKYNQGYINFCSKKCSTTFTNSKRTLSDTTKNKIKNSLVKFNKDNKRVKVLYNYDCEKCGVSFENTKIRNERKKTCEKCRKKRVVKAIEGVNSLYELSSRTVQKIIKRAGVKCAICNWDKTTLDIHHIHGRKIEDANNHKNLVCLCPNCHRLAHENKISKKELENNSIDKVFIDWKKYYNDLSKNGK